MLETITNGMGMVMVRLPAGRFSMGGDWDEEQADENELPRHEVVFQKAFYLGQHAVSQAQWQAVMGDNPSTFKDADRPVEMVSHDDAKLFVKALNDIESTRTYRLPTEAEWEYAARAQSQSAYCFGPEVGRLAKYAWFRDNSGGSTHPVGQLSPNDWGLYDMHGNLHEWCADWYDRHFYATSPARHPVGPRQGVARVLRGGDWGSAPWYCRSAIRSLSSPQRRSPRVGFRVAKDVAEPARRWPSAGMVKKLFSKDSSAEFRQP